MPEASRLLAPVSANDPTVTISFSEGSCQPAEHWSEDLVSFPFQANGGVTIDRNAMSVSFVFADSRPSDEEIVHPYLASTAAVLSRWAGRDTLHASAFRIGSGAWAFVGDKGSGKSSTVAYLAASGIDMVTDDVVVIDGEQHVLAGPACIDLRPDAAEHFGIGTHLGLVGARERSRVYTTPAPPRTPVRGFIVPTWSDEIALVRVPPPQRLPLLLKNQTWLLPPVRPASFLDLAALPFWEFRRPRIWASLAEATDRLLDALHA